MESLESLPFRVYLLCLYTSPMIQSCLWHPWHRKNKNLWILVSWWVCAEPGTTHPCILLNSQISLKFALSATRTWFGNPQVPPSWRGVSSNGIWSERTETVHVWRSSTVSDYKPATYLREDRGLTQYREDHIVESNFISLRLKPSLAVYDLCSNLRFLKVHQTSNKTRNNIANKNILL